MGEIVNFEPKPRRRKIREFCAAAQVLPFLGVRYLRGPEAEAALEKAAYDQAARRLTPPSF